MTSVAPELVRHSPVASTTHTGSRPSHISKSPVRRRIGCIDWMRGLSVLFMVECHSLYFLHPSHDGDAARRYLQQLNGLLAPQFILTAGFSIALVCGRIGRLAAEDRGARFRKTLRRIGQVMLVSVWLKLIYWNFTVYPNRLLWVNVLDCIAMSLLVILPIVLYCPFRRLILLAGAVAFFTVVPLVQSPKAFGAFTGFINNSLYPDTWPLIPWAGYAFIGALLGLRMARVGKLSSLWLSFLALLGLGLLVVWLARPIGWLYGDNPAWLVVNAAERIWRIGAIGLLLLTLEMLASSRPVLFRNPIIWTIELFSRQSLYAFALHLVFLFGMGRFRPFNRFHQSTDWRLYVVLTLAVVACTGICCVLIENARPWLTAMRHRPA